MKQNHKIFLDSRETAQGKNPRLEIFISEYIAYKNLYKKPLKVLDIGCGRNPEIFSSLLSGDVYYGCDFYTSICENISHYKKIDLNEEKLSEKFKGESFDVIFCGEVLEHLFSPDFLICEIKKLMHPDSILILSTPNLGYYLNRLMLLFGISPFFLENSSEYKFGRMTKFMGKMNPTEGHIRLFTYAALKEFVLFYGFEIIKIVPSVGPWAFFIDRLISKISRSLSATNVFVLKLKTLDGLDS